MKTIVAGSREGIPPEAVMRAIESCPWVITQVVSGRARGVDASGEIAADALGIPVAIFPADWTTHGKAAGPIRNRQMLDYADALIAVWDGKSRGTANMVGIARAKGIPIHEVIVAKGAK